MPTVESGGAKNRVFVSQLLPIEGKTFLESVYYCFRIDKNDWTVPALSLRPSLLSSAPLTQQQIELGVKIARKHGLTE